MADEVDVGMLHETLLHFMSEHSPLIIKVRVEFESPSYDLESSQRTAEFSPDTTSSQDLAENSTEDKPQEPFTSEEDKSI